MSERLVDKLLRLSQLYWESGAIFAANDLGIFSMLSETPMDIASIKRKTQVDDEGLWLLLDILVAQGFLEKEGGLYKLDNSLIPLFRDAPQYGEHILKHYARGWTGWGDASNILRGKLRRKHATKEETKHYAFKMEFLARYIAPIVAETVDLASGARMLDLGSGSGWYAISFAERFPQLVVLLVDKEEVLELAVQNIERSGLSERITMMAGDILQLDLKKSFDVVLLSNVLHVFSKNEVKLVLEKAYQALREKGIFIVVDYMISEGRPAPLETLLFSLHLAIHSDKARCYTLSELADFCYQLGADVLKIEPLDVKLTAIASRNPTVIIARKGK